LKTVILLAFLHGERNYQDLSQGRSRADLYLYLHGAWWSMKLHV